MVTAAKIKMVYENPFKWWYPRNPMAKNTKKEMQIGPASNVEWRSNIIIKATKQESANASEIRDICNDFKIKKFMNKYNSILNTTNQRKDGLIQYFYNPNFNWWW